MARRADDDARPLTRAARDAVTGPAEGQRSRAGERYRPRVTMRDVDLVETDDTPAEAPAGEREPSFLDRVRRHPRWLAAGAAVVVALVAFQVVSDRRVQAQDDARAAALADVPFVLDPVDPSFPVFLHGTYSWDDEGIPPAVSAYLGMGVPVAGVVVTGTQGSGTGDSTVVGLDPATGEPVWETAIAAPADGTLGRGAWCSLPDDPDGTTTRCTAYWQAAVPPRQPDGELGWTYRSLSDLTSFVEVDATDGTVLRRTDVPVGATVGVAAWGLVVGTVDGTTLTLEAADWDDEQRWTRVLDLPQPDELSYLSIAAVEDRVLVTTGASGFGWVLDAHDGSEATTLRGDPESRSGGSTLLPSGAVVTDDPVFTSDEMSGDSPAMLVLRDGTEVPLDGDHLAWVGLDDGTLGDALLTGTTGSTRYVRERDGGTAPTPAAADGSVARLREPDGSVRWEVPGLDVSTAIAVDGVLVARTDDEVVAVDARSGQVRWRTATPDGDAGYLHQLLTDGRVILVPRGTQLDALSFRGERLWSVHVARAGEGHVVRPGPAPTPAPTGVATATGDQISWIGSPSGRLALGISDFSGSVDEYLVFDPLVPSHG